MAPSLSLLPTPDLPLNESPITVITGTIHVCWFCIAVEDEEEEEEGEEGRNEGRWANDDAADSKKKSALPENNKGQPIMCECVRVYVGIWRNNIPTVNAMRDFF